MKILLALAALCAGAAIATLWTSSGLLAAIAGGAAGVLAVARRPGPPAARGALERYAPLALAAFFIPVFTLAVAPGADMAMHVALARGLLQHQLSPAWPGVHPLLYPRGFSALVALVSFAGLPRAGSIASAFSYLVFWAGLALLLARLGAGSPRTVALLCLFASPWPQQYFLWGGNPTALALGLAFLAAAHLEEPALVLLFMGGAAAVHPLGAAAGLLVVAAVAVRERRVWGGAAAACAFLTLAAALHFFGPVLSPAEARWIADYALGPEKLEWKPLAALALASALIGIRVRALLAVAAVALLLLALPHLGLYAIRFAPIALVPLGLALAAAPRPLWVAVALAGCFVHVRDYQRAMPMATRNDLAALRCADAAVPPSAPIDGAYGDATQWIPALLGRPVTHAHVHVSVFDETRLPTTAAFRFTGERLRYGDALPRVSGRELCRSGGAFLVELPR